MRPGVPNLYENGAFHDYHISVRLLSFLLN